MKKVVFSGVVLGVLLYCGSAQAVTIGLDLQTFPSTSRARMLIDISGLVPPDGPDLLGAFDLDLKFDETVFTLTGVVFNTSLGLPDSRTFGNQNGTLVPSFLGAGESITNAVFLSPGQSGVNLAGVSLLSETELSNRQPDVFNNIKISSHELASLGFSIPQTLGAEAADPEAEQAKLVRNVFNSDSVTLSINFLGDGKGKNFTAQVVKNIPVPSTIFLLGIGLLSLGWATRKLK